MYMEEGLDTGDMLAKASTAIDRKTGQQLHDELAVMGAELLVDTLPKLGSLRGEKQDDSLHTYAPMISKQEGHVDFSRPPEEIERLVRAFDPWPGTYCHYGDRMMKMCIRDRPVKSGEQILVGGNDMYVSLCRKHYNEGRLGPKE